MSTIETRTLDEVQAMARTADRLARMIGKTYRLDKEWNEDVHERSQEKASAHAHGKRA